MFTLTNRLRPAALLRLLLGILLPLVIVGLIGEDVLERARFAFEQPLMLAIHARATPALDAVALTLHVVGGTLVIGPLSAAMLALLWWRDRHAAPFFALAVGGAAVILGLMKLAFGRTRPELWPRLVAEHGPSFPSGHTTFSSALMVALVLILWRTPWRWPAVILGSAFALAVGASRVYLGVHYPTDVLAGWLTGLAWVLGVYSLLPPHARHAAGTDAKVVGMEETADAPADR